MVEYLTEVNQGLEADEWLVTCLIFAPNAPEQNPTEDIWLKAKQCVRKNWRICDHFSTVTELFLEAIQNRFFDFPKLHMYGLFS
jgi:transposase